MDWRNGQQGSTRRSVGVTLTIVMLVAMAVPGAALATKPAVTCSVHPGDSSVTWKRERQTTRLELAWFDGDGVAISSVTVVPTKEMHSRYSQQTPEGAAEFGVEFWDDSGPFAVGGLTCT